LNTFNKHLPDDEKRNPSQNALGITWSKNNISVGKFSLFYRVFSFYGTQPGPRVGFRKTKHESWMHTLTHSWG